ncbi:Helicase SEN1 [Linum perenne]
MSYKLVSRRELLDKWRGIEEEEENTEDDDPLLLRRLHRQKEEWFKNAFTFLIDLPKESHIWCGFWDIMGPLLETFYNYFKDERQDSPLRLLWKRISDETQLCIQCISQHHQAQDMYNSEYESSSIGPLLDVLRSLDEERLTIHLREINSRLKKEEYNPERDNAEVVSLMYEVLMFPVLLDDQSLFVEFELFIEAVDNMHELALGHQQFPGVYALLFCNRRVRTVGRRLARSMEKLKRSTDLEPLQPLLNKFIGFLESEVLPSASRTSRPRVQLDRLSIWLGMTSLLEFLEPPAFEEGIMERYPIFFDVVLNHVSGDSAEFSHAVNFLRELFKILGCKLWLRSTLSPSVLRNTLLGQCFHTRSEKIHKEIFDLFPPFLQSLEALQDGEHEKQRRHFLYFLLHQVSVSNNFNTLTRKLACKIALLIVHRGYKMTPPCPPFECAHMWGPSLVSCLKDSSLHNSLRQPAFDLMETIIVSDTAALQATLFNDYTHVSEDRGIHDKLNDDDDEDGLPFTLSVEEKDNCCWSGFSAQSNITCQECRGWMCVPMLWIDVLVDTDPSILPVSFSKAVFWARSHLTLVEPESSPQMTTPVKTWLTSSVSEISASFVWKVPTGSDDGGDGKESKNSVRVSMMHLPLIRAFSRLAAQFIVRVGQCELRKQWTWDPRMAKCLILSLLDANDDVRQFGKCVLEQISNTRGLASSLKFLCSSSSSLSAILLGFRHACKVVLLDSVILRFHTLQHFFFVLGKLTKEGDLPNPDSSEKASDNLNVCEIAWPSILKCLVAGKDFIDYSLCQMTCVRVLEILPIVVGRLRTCFGKKCSVSKDMVESLFDYQWLKNLIDWGKSSLKVVVVYWKRALASVLNDLKLSCSSASAETVRTIENLILTEQVSHLRISLCGEVPSNSGAQASSSEGVSSVKRYSSLRLQFHGDEDHRAQLTDLGPLSNREDKPNVIVLSDEDEEYESVKSKVKPSSTDSNCDMFGGEYVPDRADCDSLQAEAGTKFSTVSSENTGMLKDSLFDVPKKDKSDLSLNSQKQGSNKTSVTFPAPLKSSEAQEKRGEAKSRVKPQPVNDSKTSSNEAVSFRNSIHTSDRKAAEGSNAMRNELVRDTDNLWEPAVSSGKQQKSCFPKINLPGPKRQVIQLKTPWDNRHGNMQRLEASFKRFKPPRLDEWYRSILGIDYYAIVGLGSAKEDENSAHKTLKKVPVSFESPEQYIDIFRPLVLEEFKAQLQSSYMEMSSWEDTYYGSISVLSVERVDDFHLVRFVHDDKDSTSSKSFFENDLVLLTKEAPESASHDIHMVGKVDRRERDHKRGSSILLIRFYFLNGSTRLNQARRQLMERSKWHATRIMSITPQLREFHALSSIHDIPLLPAILKPVTDILSRVEPMKLTSCKLSPPLQQLLETSFNDSQIQAISTAISLPRSRKDFELSLIQGPPGTGKTRTIVAIVSGLLSSVNGTRQASGSFSGQNQQPDGTFSSRPKVRQSIAVARAWQDAAMARQLNDDMERNVKETGSCSRRRVLICAQSNAAVDELVSRISSDGLYGDDGNMYKPYLVRVGNSKTVHSSSLPFFIDTMVDHRVAEEKMHLTDAKSDISMNSSIDLRSNLEKLVDHIRFYEAKRANLKEGNSQHVEDEKLEGDDPKEMSCIELEVKLRKLYEQKKQMFRDLSAAQAQEKKTSEEIRGLKHKLRKTILKEAEIVVTTLSGCGGDLYTVCSESISSHKFGNASEHTLFDAVVIDEAAQALEPATLIPLRLLKSKGTKCIMVGDPKQLPATVLSSVASKFFYECSMFERLQRAGHPVTMLTKQYRMHPEICRFPSLHFYEGKLLNGEKMSAKSAPFHETEGLGPYVFYDVVDGQELRGKSPGTMSLYNEHEAEAAVQLLKFFKQRYPTEIAGARIGIVTPYKFQLSILRARLSRAFGSSFVADMELNTVDGFQGREVDILMLSTVRASPANSNTKGSNSSSIGFVADVRRMNVALTRAKFSLWILGNARTLQSNPTWAALVKDARERNLVISSRKPYDSMFKTSQRVDHASEKSSNRSKYAKNAETCHTRNPGKQKQDKVQPTLSSATCVNSNTQGELEVDRHCDNSSIRKGDRRNRRNRGSNGQDLAVMKDSNEKNDSNEKDSNEKMLSKNPKFATAGKSEVDVEGKRDKKSKKGNRGNSHTDGGKDESLTNQSQRGGKELSVHESKRKSEVSTSREDKSRDKQVKPVEDPQKVDTAKDLITKRKQQRQEVDAILFSSLIPTKKSKPSERRNPPKRAASPSSTVTGGMRPPKTKRGKQFSVFLICNMICRGYIHCSLCWRFFWKFYVLFLNMKSTGMVHFGALLVS